MAVGWLTLLSNLTYNSMNIFRLIYFKHSDIRQHNEIPSENFNKLQFFKACIQDFVKFQTLIELYIPMFDLLYHCRSILNILIYMFIKLVQQNSKIYLQKWLLNRKYEYFETGVSV